MESGLHLAHTHNAPLSKELDELRRRMTAAEDRLRSRSPSTSAADDLLEPQQASLYEAFGIV